MTEVSLFRLYLIRAAYLLMAVGTAFTIWPQLLDHPTPWPLWRGVGTSTLGAMSILAVWGVRYPLQMLPVMFFELVWKSIWLVSIGLPLWLSGKMDADNLETAQNVLLGAIFLFVIPWRYALENYVLKSGDRWW